MNSHELIREGLQARHGQEQVSALRALFDLAAEDPNRAEELAETVVGDRFLTYNTREQAKSDHGRVLPFLKICMVSSSTTLRRWALRLVRSADCPALLDSMRSILQDRVADSDSWIQVLAATLLAEEGVRDSRFVDIARVSLESTNPSEAFHALLLCERLGPLALPAAEALAAHLGDGDPDHRAQAKRAMASVTGTEPPGFSLIDQLGRKP